MGALDRQHKSAAGKPCEDCYKCHETAWKTCPWLGTTLPMSYPTGIGSDCVVVQDYIFGTFLWGKDPTKYTGTTNLTDCSTKLSTWLVANTAVWELNCGYEHDKCETQGRCSKCWKCRALVKKNQRCAETCKKSDFCHREAAKDYPGSWQAFGQCFATGANGCGACDACEKTRGFGQCGTLCSACNTCKTAVITQFGNAAKHYSCIPLMNPCTTCLNSKMKKGQRQKWRMKARKVVRHPVRKTNKKTRRAAMKERGQKRRASKKARRQKRRKSTPTKRLRCYK